jgi:hypothetical protein
MNQRIESPPGMREVFIKARNDKYIIGSPVEYGETYKVKRDSASGNVTSPISIGSISGPISKLALTGTKKDFAAVTLS